MLARGFRVTEISFRHVSGSSGRPSIASQIAFVPHVGILRRPVQTQAPASNPRRFSRLAPIAATSLKSSHWSLVAVLGATLVAAILLDPFFRDQSTSQISPDPSPSVATLDTVIGPDSALPRTPSYSDMPISPGHLGNLTPEQEQKLREFWSLTLKAFGVTDHSISPAAPGIAAATPPISEPSTDTESPKSSKKKHLSLFSRKHHDDTINHTEDVSSSKNTINAGAVTAAATEEDDKYGQTKEFQATLRELSPEDLRSAFWSMVKCDHPDALLLRFLRARKWDINRALVMLISTMRWRSKEMHVDDDIMQKGEEGALADSKSGDGFAKKEGEELLWLIKRGESFLHGVDKEGRPLCYVRVRLHKQGEASERVLERYTVFTIETARLVLRPPVETATILFDMTSFTLSNMDYAPIKFMIKIFEANYPESLGAVLVHKSPWVFQGIWNIIKGWLDPVVAAKVHFTKSVEDLEQYIPRSQIVKELGGEEDWEYNYLEPRDGENDTMKDAETRTKLQTEREKLVLDFQKRTFDWATGRSSTKETQEEREQLAQKLNQNYWQLDPYVRARSLYDRQGMIGSGGEIDFYPDRRKTNGEAKSAPDDVD